jgi:hypothetical protein
MSRRAGRGPGGREQPPAGADTEADATVVAIAGLRRQLKRPGALEHPDVLRELRRLDEQVTAQLAGQAGRKPGRHRQHAEHISGAAGCGFKPDPLTADTAEQFIRVLWMYKIWRGNPSFREMAARAGQTVVHSTMHAAMHRTTMPKLYVVKAIITGCGGDADDVSTFTAAWQRIETRNISFHSAPVPALRLVPGS